MRVMTRSELRQAIATHETITVRGGVALVPRAWPEYYLDCLAYCERYGLGEIDTDQPNIPRR